MRVLVIHCMYKYKGGEDTVVDSEVRLLRSHGVETDLLLFSNAKRTGVRMLQLPFNIGAFLAVIRKIREFRPTIVHVHNLHFGATLSVFYAIRSCRVPFVTTLHNYRFVCPSGILYHKRRFFSDSLQSRFPWKAVRQGVYRDSKWLTFWVALSMSLHRSLGTLELCSRYIVLSGDAKKIFLRSGIKCIGDRMAIKGNFCDYPSDYWGHPQTDDADLKATRAGVMSEISAFRNAGRTAEGGEYFLYVGRLSEEKGVQILLKAFAKCNYRIMIAGEGPLAGEVIRYSQRYAHIKYLGAVEKIKVIGLLKGCTALVFPSVWPEGMPMIILEAFSCAVPVIASRIGVMKGMIEDGYNGIHFQPGNCDHLLDKLRTWCRLGPEKKERYRRNAMDTFLDHFTPERNYLALTSIYSEVIDHYPPHIKNIPHAKDQLTEHTHSYRQL